MDKVAKLGQATESERLGWKYFPIGETLAAKYLRDDANLLGEVSQYQGDAKKYVSHSAAEVLIKNIGLPKNEVAKKKTRKAMDGLQLLKEDKVGLENIFSRFRYLFSHYEEQGEQQRQHAYQSLKEDMTARIQQALQQQLGTAAAGKIDIEKQPQFQQEWRKVQDKLDTAYLTHLKEYKQALSAIS